MYCPVCRAEYRPEIARCSTCDVDLVTELAASSAGSAVGLQEEHIEAEAMMNYCGFHALEEAREAREQLRKERIRSEILIRDGPRTGPASVPAEEYWLRVVPRDFATVASILGYEGADADEEPAEAEGAVSCSDCGAAVGEHETFCPHCGARFE